MMRKLNATEAARELLARRRARDIRVAFVAADGRYTGVVLVPSPGGMVRTHDDTLAGLRCPSAPVKEER